MYANLGRRNTSPVNKSNLPCLSDVFAALENDINYWSIFGSVVLLGPILMISLSEKANIISCSIIGAFASALSVDYYIGSNLRFIVINIIRRATVPKFKHAIVDPPFQTKGKFTSEPQLPGRDLRFTPLPPHCFSRYSIISRLDNTVRGWDDLATAADAGKTALPRACEFDSQNHKTLQECKVGCSGERENAVTSGNHYKD